MENRRYADGGPLAHRVEQGTFNPKVPGRAPGGLLYFAIVAMVALVNRARSLELIDISRPRFPPLQ